MDWAHCPIDPNQRVGIRSLTNFARRKFQAHGNHHHNSFAIRNRQTANQNSLRAGRYDLTCSWSRHFVGRGVLQVGLSRVRVHRARQRDD